MGSTFTTWKAIINPPRIDSSERTDSKRLVTAHVFGKAPANMTSK